MDQVNEMKKANGRRELNLNEVETVNGAGVAEFFKELLECILDGAVNAD